MGVAATALYVGLRDRWRNRPQMALEVVGGQAFYAFLSGPSGRWYYARLPPEGQEPKEVAEDEYGQPTEESETSPERTSLFVILDVLLQNRSWRDDALITCRLVLSRKRGLVANAAALVRLDRSFFGENVPAHSLRDLHLVFAFDGADFATISEWRYERDTVFALEAKTIRDRVLTKKVHPNAFTVAHGAQSLADSLDPYIGISPGG